MAYLLAYEGYIMMKYIQPPTPASRRILSIAFGIILIVGGLFLMFDFLLKFLKFVVGLILVVVGIQFLWRR